MSSEHASDPLSILAVVTISFVLVMAWVIHRITDPIRNSGHRDPVPRNQHQHADGQGRNFYDASSHTTSNTTLNVGEVNVNSPRLPERRRLHLPPDET